MRAGSPLSLLRPSLSRSAPRTHAVTHDALSRAHPLRVRPPHAARGPVHGSSARSLGGCLSALMGAQRCLHIESIITGATPDSTAYPSCTRRAGKAAAKVKPKSDPVPSGEPDRATGPPIADIDVARVIRRTSWGHYMNQRSLLPTVQTLAEAHLHAVALSAPSRSPTHAHALFLHAAMGGETQEQRSHVNSHAQSLP